MFKAPIFATAAALIAIAAAVPAAADTKAWQVGNDSMHLYQTGANVNSAEGRAELLAAVERAAGRLCRDRSDARECAAEAVASTGRQPGAGALRLAMAERDAVRLAAR